MIIMLVLVPLLAPEPAEGSKLVGAVPVPLKSRVKGVIQLTAQDGAIVQGKL